MAFAKIRVQGYLAERMRSDYGYDFLLFSQTKEARAVIVNKTVVGLNRYTPVLLIELGGHQGAGVRFVHEHRVAELLKDPHYFALEFWRSMKGIRADADNRPRKLLVHIAGQWMRWKGVGIDEEASPMLSDCLLRPGISAAWCGCSIC